MKREEFLQKFSLGLLAVCAGDCLSACKKNSATTDDSIPVAAPPVGQSIVIDLNTELKTVGESKLSNGVIIARIASGNSVSAFSAVQAACTHQGTSVVYSPNKGRFVCPNHGSEFNTTGVVLSPPARLNLRAYTASISGSTLTIVT